MMWLHKTKVLMEYQGCRGMFGDTECFFVSCIHMLLQIMTAHVLHRGSDMRAHVLLNVLTELRKKDKMLGLPSILIHFRSKFNKFNNTGARMLDSIYHMT